MKIYNTIAKEKQELVPRNGKEIHLFVCGPTVYDYSHIGHARTYISFDVIVKYLRYAGYKVLYLQNITDIDDKVIARAKEKKTDPLKLSEKFTKEYYKDMKSLKVNSVSKYAKATDYINEIIHQVRVLIDKGFAYELEDGIYFNISRFKDYGKLSGRTALEADDSVTRIDDSIGKKNKGDFCIWKFPKPGDPKWETDLGAGRPGWHIEDTAITEHSFGPQYDIHGGGRDLIFPHHEAEISIMESVSGREPMVKYWMHTGFLNVEGKKMSKSLGNFITIREALKEHEPDVLRFMFLSTHYRSPIDYSEASLKQAEANLEKIRTAFSSAKKSGKAGAKYLKEFEKAMDDDFNTPKVIALLLEIAKQLNKTGDNSFVPVLKKIGDVLSIDFNPRKNKIPADVMRLVKQRDEARKKKDWGESDRIRDELKEQGYELEDDKGKTRVKVR